jgi:hypothetical protein
VTDENHAKHESGYPVSNLPKVQPIIFRIQAGTVTNCATCCTVAWDMKGGQTSDAGSTRAWSNSSKCTHASPAYELRSVLFSVPQLQPLALQHAGYFSVPQIIFYCYLHICILLETWSEPPVVAGLNTSTVALRVVGDEKGTQCLGV